MSKKRVSLEVVNPNAAGIDVGSKSHWVSVGQDSEDVKEFGVYTDDTKEMSAWLKSHKVITIAMESTGTYWQNVYSQLIGEGFEVILVNGRQTKNIKGKKTDILDCQWIQKLHTLGLLSASFLPDNTTGIIRTYSRHRQNVFKQIGSTTLKLQKYLRLMNLRLDVVVSDIVGLTGRKIITEFVSGETQGKKLAKHRHYNCRKSEEEIARALQYNGRADYYFAMKQEWKTFLHLQGQIDELDAEIKKTLRGIVSKGESNVNLVAKKKPTRERIKMLLEEQT